MKRMLVLLLSMILCFCLMGCSNAVGGTYKLEYSVANGVRIPPSNVGMNITFELNEDGSGTALYGADTQVITWVEDGSTVVVSGSNGELRFSKDGENLVLHDEGTMLFFMLQEEEETDD